jgi:hypothetical protein
MRLTSTSLICPIAGCAILVAPAIAALAAPPNQRPDILFVSAQRATETIKSGEATVARSQSELVDALQSAVAQFDGKDLRASDQILETMRPLVYELSAQAHELLNRQDDYLQALRTLHDAYQAAPEAFHKASLAFAQFADEEPYAELKQDYQALSESWATLAVRIKSQDEALIREGVEIKAFRQHLDRTTLFLDRLGQHLAAFPDLSNANDQRERHLALLRRYVDGFESLRTAIRNFHQKLKEQPPPAADRPAAARRASPEVKPSAPEARSARTAAYPIFLQEGYIGRVSDPDHKLKIGCELTVYRRGERCGKAVVRSHTDLSAWVENRSRVMAEMAEGDVLRE